VGSGWKTGKTRQQYPSFFILRWLVNCVHKYNIYWHPKATAGTVAFQVYGWTKNPLVEYYIIEDYTNANQYAGGGSKGTVTCDGSDYTIYETTRTNSPSIVGPRPSTNTFASAKRRDRAVPLPWQIISTLGKASMNLGAHDYQVLSTEGYNNAAGSTSQKISTGPAS
jgi:endo-1,4-beta-xylanase